MANATLVHAALALVSAVALQQYTARRVATKKRLADEAKRQQQSKRPSIPSANIADQTDGPQFIVEIEYCTGCRWMLRAAWLAQELLTTFQQDATSRLRSVTLTPNSRQGGVFQIYLHAMDGSVERELLWSRKVVGRFPESKELKQIVRDHVSPDMGLGHSDKK
ncbi:hypothetical protein Poli38472_002868 [Pythium oligandrum]|uniref:Selenoprotein W n=1 Tax=Pythium oligandrum TaxID=41045 RepID=A0A8K1C5S9_PYTOL|nr:hypothetical protein Poli38472_002868 [Pythium oligandrum]|eukprot:TMW56943.1 hypothetical protein Poli38472_002868 [Pythium oligandrum]